MTQMQCLHWAQTIVQKKKSTCLLHVIDRFFCLKERGGTWRHHLLLLLLQTECGSRLWNTGLKCFHDWGLNHYSHGCVIFLGGSWGTKTKTQLEDVMVIEQDMNSFIKSHAPINRWEIHSIVINERSDHCNNTATGYKLVLFALDVELV